VGSALHRVNIVNAEAIKRKPASLAAPTGSNAIHPNSNKNLGSLFKKELQQAEEKFEKSKTP